MSVADPTSTRRHSTHVRARLEPVLPLANDAAASLRDHPRAVELFLGLLHLQHCIGRASVPLLRTAELEATRRAAAGDAVARGLIDYFRRHEHDECDLDALLDDYAALDRNPAEVLTQPPATAVAAMVGAVHYWVVHYHPVALVGYLAVMDGDPPTPALIDDLRDRAGVPATGKGPRRRGQDGRHHAGDDVWALLDTLPLTAPHLHVVTSSALHTVGREVVALGELAER